MTEPNEVGAAMTPEELRSYIGQHVRVLRDGMQEGVGILREVIAGTFERLNDETQQVEEVHVEDKTLRWDDDTQGEQITSRRISNVWRLVEVTG